MVMVETVVEQLLQLLNEQLQQAVDDNATQLMDAISQNLHRDFTKALSDFVGSRTAVPASVSVSTPRVATGTVVSGVKGPSRVNGHNIFVKERVAELKKEHPEGKNFIEQARSDWKALSDSERAEYSARATSQNQNEKSKWESDHQGMVVKSVTRRKTGYSLFMASLKGTFPKGVNAASYVSGKWKEMSEDEQKEWKDKAAALD